MRTVAQAVGILWMAICAAAWVWLGFNQLVPRIDTPGPLMTWLLPTLISDSQFGLTMVPILVGGVGYAIWRWGRGERAGSD